MSSCAGYVLIGFLKGFERTKKIERLNFVKNEVSDAMYFLCCHGLGYGTISVCPSGH